MLLNLRSVQDLHGQVATSQRECNVDDTAFGQGRGRVIGSQQDFDTFLSNCTSITGNLTVGPDYQGSLNITGVTRIDDLTHIAPPLGLTDIYLSDVGYIRYLRFKGMASLRQISAPNLLTVGGVELGSSTLLYISLPRLETVENFVMLKGQIGRYTSLIVRDDTRWLM